jgi:alginate O-acetyltransferase complex protein AlgJ
MDKVNSILVLGLAFLASLGLYFLLDKSPLFYCANIGLILFISLPLIFWRILKLKLRELKKDQIGKLVFVFVFFVIICFPLIDQLTSVSKDSKFEFKMNEKRILSRYESLEFDEIDSFPNMFTNFFNDHFGLRSMFISTNNYVKTVNFGISSTKKVILGSNDWLFYNDCNSLQDHLGNISLSDGQLNKISLNLLKRKAYLKARGIEYFVAFLPDKMGIYSSDLPAKYNTVDTTRIDQLIDFVADKGIKIIDVRSQFLKAAKSGKQLYQKNDSHWNKNGGLIASQVIIDNIKKKMNTIREPYSSEDYEITEKEKRGGDLSNLLGLYDFLPGKRFDYKLKDKSNPKKNIVEPKYAIYKKEYKHTFVHERDINTPKLLVFNDSFISYIHGFLGDYFSRSVYVWSHDFRKDFIEIEKPDIVLHMFVERSIMELGKNKKYYPLK